MNMQEFLPPHDADAEAAVLGSILIDADAIYDVADMLTPEMFYRPANQYIYAALQALHSRREPFDLLAVAGELRRMGRYEEVAGNDYLFELLNSTPTSVNADVYARLVAEAATRRRLIYAAGRIAKEAYKPETPVTDVMTLAEQEIFAIGGQTQRGAVEAPQRYMAAYLEEFMADMIADTPPRTIGTGLTDLDKLLGGLERGHQYLLAGATSMGKSSMALGLALDAALQQGKRVLVFSLEMSREQLVNRFVSLLTNIPVERLKPPRRRELSEAERVQVMGASGRISDAALFLDCTAGITPADVRSRASRIAVEHGLDLVIVDHMHIMQPTAPTGKQVQDLGTIAMELANAYKTLDVAGVTLAQLNRDVGKRAIKTPMLSDLRESGQIEENAYVVMFVHRPAYYEPETENPNVARVIVAKNRDGATGSVEAYWNPKIAAFKNLAFQEIVLNPPPRTNGVYHR